MCLYPKLIKNPKYKANQKNGGQVPPVTDPRTLYVPIGCQNCMECRKQKAREWQVRLLEDIKQNKNGVFVTLTFSNESIEKLNNEIPEDLTGYERDNAIATRAVRLFTERWRKRHKKTLRHWLTTELGHNGTQNIHLHGIVWTDHRDQIDSTWQYGYVWKGTYTNEATVNYTIKYVHKMDKEHQYYKSIILCSRGIGRNYTTSTEAKQNKYNNNNTREYYRTRKGHKLSLPIYYRNKLYTDQEREQLWINRLDTQKRYVLGQEIDISKSQRDYFAALIAAQEKNRRLGYRAREADWERQAYENELRNLQLQKRISTITINTEP